MPAGRPTDYRAEYCDDIVEFFHDRLVAYENRPEALEDPDRKGHQPPVWFPTFQRYAVKIGVCYDTIKEWAKVHPEFSAAKKKAKAIQDAILVQCGLAGEYENSVAIFTMKNTMRWSDRSDLNVGGQQGNPVQTETFSPDSMTEEERAKIEEAQRIIANLTKRRKL